MKRLAILEAKELVPQNSTEMKRNICCKYCLNFSIICIQFRGSKSFCFKTLTGVICLDTQSKRQTAPCKLKPKICFQIIILEAHFLWDKQFQIS